MHVSYFRQYKRRIIDEDKTTKDLKKKKTLITKGADRHAMKKNIAKLGSKRNQQKYNHQTCYCYVIIYEPIYVDFKWGYKGERVEIQLEIN